jgi:eukaryotic-like serine/threonine-protein kinase
METKLGPFILKEIIGQGGMGKVYKAYDPVNHRDVALKVIKDTLLKNSKSKKRFLREAYIHAKLHHPAIIPIHGIEIHDEGMGYSMPFVEGSTLKTHLLKIRDNPSSMPLRDRLRHIIRVLEALEYTHGMGYVHRDIKADNIFIGIHNETYLFDWGLAAQIGEADEPLDEDHNNSDLTKPGKIPGTLTHLAPERAHGIKGSIQSDIFSLGVVLYQLITLKMPFYRKDLEHFKTVAGHETFTLPSLINQKEDIDESLDLICIRALSNDLSKRYHSTKQFKEDLLKVLDGLPLWKDPLLLDITKKDHWLYQDILPLGSYLALTQKALSWGLLSVPYLELKDNYKLEMSFPLQHSGFKIYLNLDRDSKGFNLDHCYIIEIDQGQSISLHRVFALLEKATIHESTDGMIYLVIEKIENRFCVFINDQMVFDVLNQIPSICPYIGIVVESIDIKISKMAVYNASSNKQISCLKLGDTLMWHGHFEMARSEYAKIFSSFDNHQEGLHALFRLGYSYILEAKKFPSKQRKLLNLCIQSFEKFKHLKAAPWEYWGKALCYEQSHQKEEMIKCFELGFRKYPRHYFTNELKEELVTLFSQKSVKAKKEALMLAFVALRYLDDESFLNKYPTLIDSLDEELNQIYILLDHANLTKKQKLIFALAFALDQKTFLEERLTKSENLDEKINSFLILCHLNSSLLKKNFIKSTCKDLGIDDLSSSYISRKMALNLARQALLLFGKIILTEQSETMGPEESFYFGLNQLIHAGSVDSQLNLHDFDRKILFTLVEASKKGASYLKDALKNPIFQESEHFIRSNFIISLLDKKSLDYFGYDKSCLEFAIKALF